MRAADYPTKPSAKPLPELRDLDCGDGREHIGAHRGESIVRLRRAERPIRHLVQRDIQHETRAIVAERHRVVIVSWVIHQAQLPLESELVRRSIGLDHFGEHVLTRHRQARPAAPHLDKESNGVIEPAGPCELGEPVAAQMQRGNGVCRLSGLEAEDFDGSSAEVEAERTGGGARRPRQSRWVWWW